MRCVESYQSGIDRPYFSYYADGPNDLSWYKCLELEN